MAIPDVDEAGRSVAKMQDKALETVIKKLLQALMSWDDRGPWGNAYGAFYAAHIKVLSSLLSTELKYHGAWQHLIDTCHAVDDYTREIRRLRLLIPKPYEADKTHVEELVLIMDRELQGNMRVFEMAFEKVAKINQFLKHDKPYNIFAFLMGTTTLSTARNDVCMSVSQFCDESDRLVALRNEWARQISKSAVFFNLRNKMSAACPQTIF